MEQLRTSVASAYSTVPFVGPDTTSVYGVSTSTHPAINASSWTAEFGSNKASELSMLTFHYYPYSQSSAVANLLQTDTVLIVLNKDASDANIQMTATLPSSYSLGSIYELTQGNGSALPNLSAAPGYPGQDAGITIQGASVNNTTWAYTQGTPNYLVPSGNTVSFYVPALSPVVVQLTQ